MKLNFAHSPFKTKVEPRFDANLVKVTGEGVRQEGVLASLPVAFTVDARDAGLADLEVAIQVFTSRNSASTIFVSFHLRNVNGDEIKMI